MPADAPITGVRVAAFRVRGPVEQADFVGSAIAASLRRDLETAPGLRVVDDRAPAASGTADLEGEFRRGDAESCLEVRARVAGRTEPLWTVSRCSTSDPITELIARLAQGCLDALGRERPDRYPYIDRVGSGKAMAASPLAAEAHKLLLDVDAAGLAKIGDELVRRFPSEPDAHVIRAWALMLSWDAAPSVEGLSALKEELGALKALDPNSPYADVIRAYVYRFSGAAYEARQLYTRVLERKDLTPAAKAWVVRQRSFTYLQAGRADAARLDAEEGVRLDPASGPALVALSKALEAAGDLDGAFARAREAVALEPNSWRDLQRVGIAAMHAKSHDQAADYLGRACDVSNNQEACANLAVALQRAGRGEAALRVALGAEKRPGSRWGDYNLACVWALRGDRDAALAALRRAFDLGFADVAITSDPDLTSLRGDPEFQAEVQKVLARIRARRSIATAAFPWQG